MMSENYIRRHFSDIKGYAGAIERRMEDEGLTIDSVLADNAYYFEMCQKYGCHSILIDDSYQVEIHL